MSSRRMRDHVATHRRALKAKGRRRLEVTVPAADADLVKAVAATLRAGGEEGERLRALLVASTRPQRARTGEELVAFFRASPLVAEEISFERDDSTGRTISLG